MFTDGIKSSQKQTRGVVLAKKRKSSERLPIKILESMNGVVGANLQESITKFGIIICQYAPVQVGKWSDINKNARNDLLKMLKVRHS